ncbi:MAG: hypothetical protein U0165_15990 [Polyangiaceae bacterium]
MSCWGSNPGQLAIPILYPLTAIDGISDASEVQVGDRDHCVLTTGGDLKCWGANFSGKLGIVDANNVAVSTVSTPTKVPTSGHVTSFALGTSKHTCFIDNAKVYCMGSNASKQLGRDGTDSPVPVEVVW